MGNRGRTLSSVRQPRAFSVAVDRLQWTKYATVTQRNGRGSASNLGKAPSNLWRLGWTRDVHVVIGSVQRGQRVRAFLAKTYISNDAGRSGRQSGSEVTSPPILILGWIGWTGWIDTANSRTSYAQPGGLGLDRLDRLVASPSSFLRQ
jgi:hypothetical protein